MSRMRLTRFWKSVTAVFLADGRPSDWYPFGIGQARFRFMFSAFSVPCWRMDVSSTDSSMMFPVPCCTTPKEPPSVKGERNTHRDVLHHSSTVHCCQSAEHQWLNEFRAVLSTAKEQGNQQRKGVAVRAGLASVSERVFTYPLRTAGER